MSSRFHTFLPLLLSLLLTACNSPEQRAADHLASAQAFFEQGNYIKARIEAMNVVQLEPKNADVRYLLSRIEESEENFQKALGHLQVAVDSNPNHVKSRIKLGNYYVSANAVELATENAAIAMRLAPDNAEVLLLQARVHILNDDSEAAEREVSAALVKDPLFVDAIMLKAGLNLGSGDSAAALRIAGDAISSLSAARDMEGAKQLRQFRIIALRLEKRYIEIEIDLKALASDFPDDADFPLALTQLYITQKRFDEAEEIFREYVARDPDEPKRRIEFARFIGSRRGSEAQVSLLQQYSSELPDSMEIQLAMGQLFESIEQPDNALATYRQIESVEPNTTAGLRARNRIAAIKIQQNKPEEAKAVVAAILGDDQTNADALMVRAAFAFAEQRFDDTVTVLRTVLREEPELERAQLLLARAHRAANNQELAREAYRRLIRQNPAHTDAANELAGMLAQSGDVQMAEKVLRDQLAADPKDRRAASSLIQALLLQGDIAGAETYARSLLALEDDSGLAEFQLGRVMQAKESGNDAIAAYRASLEKSPAAPAPLAGIVRILLDEDRVEDAVAFLRAHVDQYPTQIAPRLMLAEVNAGQGKVETAAQQYEEIIALQPGAASAYAALATLYPDDMTRRQGIYRRGISAVPKDPALQLLLAAEYEHAKQIDDAVVTYEALLADDPRNAIAANNLAALLLDQRSDARSFARALELAMRFEDSVNAAFLDTLGWAYYRNEYPGKAVRVLESVVAKQDQVAQHQYHLGMALAKANSAVRAREALEKSIRLADTDFPGIEDARATLERLGADVTVETTH